MNFQRPNRYALGQSQHDQSISGLSSVMNNSMMNNSMMNSTMMNNLNNHTMMQERSGGHHFKSFLEERNVPIFTSLESYYPKEKQASD